MQPQQNNCASCKLCNLQTIHGAHRTAQRCRKGKRAAVNPKGFGYNAAILTSALRLLLALAAACSVCCVFVGAVFRLDFLPS